MPVIAVDAMGGELAPEEIVRGVADASLDSTQWLDDVLAAVSIPVGVGCFGVEDGVRAASRGADNIVIGHPVISGPNPKEELSRFVRDVRASYRPRRSI